MNFADPFPGLVPSKVLTENDIIRSLRLDLAAEEEAVHLYTAQADAIEKSGIAVDTARVLRDIANEERVHIGEFQTLISAIDREETKFLAKGFDEVVGKFPNLCPGCRK